MEGRYINSENLSGAAIQRTSPAPSKQKAGSTEPVRQASLRSLAHIIEVTEAFYAHPKVLVTALNGPCVGLSAALVAYSDFIYAMPHTYLLCPFTSLGITAEGGSTALFSRRLGFKVAAEALIMSKRIHCDELVRCGFINEVFDTGKDSDKFMDKVLAVVDENLPAKLDAISMLEVKFLMRKHDLPLLASRTIEETLGVVGSLARVQEKVVSHSADQFNGKPRL